MPIGRGGTENGVHDKKNLPSRSRIPSRLAAEIVAKFTIFRANMSSSPSQYYRLRRHEYVGLRLADVQLALVSVIRWGC